MEVWDSIDWFDPATYVCLSQARTMIANIICRGRFIFIYLSLEVIVRLLVLVESLTTTIFHNLTNFSREILEHRVDIFNHTSYILV
jgi:hypothetical protein